MTEEELKVEFEETFGSAYLKYLAGKSTDKDLVEILWMGFAHGYKKGEKNAKMCEM